MASSARTAYKISFPIGFGNHRTEFKQSAGVTRKEDLDADDDNKQMDRMPFTLITNYTQC